MMFVDLFLRSEENDHFLPAILIHGAILLVPLHRLEHVHLAHVACGEWPVLSPYLHVSVFDALVGMKSKTNTHTTSFHT